MVEFNPNVRTEDRSETMQRPYHVPEGRIHAQRDERSVVDLFRELADEARLLLRQEVHLARAEVSQKAKSAAKHASYIAIGGALAYAGLLAIVGAACAGLFALMVWAGASIGLSLWVAPLAVGILVAIIGYGLLRSGMSRIRNDDMVPHRTAQTMRENAAWMQTRATK